MQHQLHRAHLCNVFDFEYRIATTLIANGYSQAASHSQQVLTVAKEAISTFQKYYTIPEQILSKILDYSEQFDLLEKYPGLASELASSSNLSPLKQLEYTKIDYLRKPSLRLLSRAERLKRVLGIRPRSALITCVFDQNNLFEIAQKTLSYSSIHISSYQSMSLGHMVFYAYALTYSKQKQNLSVTAWSKRDVSVCPELLDLIEDKDNQLCIQSNPWIIDRSTANDALETDHLFHQLHIVYPIKDLSTRNEFNQSLKKQMQETKKQSIFCHVRTSDYKKDGGDKNATLRNSNPKNLIAALTHLYPNNKVNLTTSDCANIPANICIQDTKTSEGRLLQMRNLISSDILITPCSGFTLFSQYGPQKLWYFNATHLFLPYPLPDNHLISPKRLEPKSTLKRFTPAELALMLLEDWNELKDHVEYVELTIDELIEEGKIFNQKLNSGDNSCCINIAEELMQMAELNHNASLDLSVQKRFVSNATIKNIRDIFEYIQAE